MKTLTSIKNSKYGLDITEIVKATKLKRSKVRTELAYLLGSNKITERKIGMSKVYTVK